MGLPKLRESHIFERSGGDWYVEPVWVSEALFRVEKFDDAIWDPACGQGNILKAALNCGIQAVGTDIVNRDMAQSDLCHDFFNSTKLHFPNIVSNPPFGGSVLAEKFIRHAIVLVPAKLAIFVDSRFLFSKGRADGLFAEWPPARVWVISPRPSCPPGEYLAAGNKAGGGTADYCWLVWDFERVLAMPTRLNWLRCRP